jgi:hypothetical protein
MGHKKKQPKKITLIRKTIIEKIFVIETRVNGGDHCENFLKNTSLIYQAL